MASFSDRRTFLKTAVGGAAGLSLAQLARPAFARESAAPIAVNKLNDTLWVFSGAGCNVVAARGNSGVALVDGGLEEHSRDLLKSVLKETAAPRIDTLFNTHWHPQQTGSNERLGKEKATIIAHENTKLWLQYANPVPLENRTWGPLPPQARPNKTIYDDATVKMMIGDEPVEYGYLLQAHTDGDIYVYFRKSNVLVTGGVVSGAGWPVIDWHTGGWIFGMVGGLQKLISLANDQTRVVPANGPLLTRADLQAQHDMYATIAGRMQKLLRKGMGPAEVVAAAPTKEFDAKWGNPTQFVTMAFESLWGHFAPDA